MKVTRIDRKRTRKKYRIVQKLTFRSNYAVRCTEPVMSEIVKDFFTSYSGADGYKKLSQDILESEQSRLGKIGTHQSSIYVDEYAYQLLEDACLKSMVTMSQLLRYITGGELFCRKSVGRITRDVDEK